MSDGLFQTVQYPEQADIIATLETGLDAVTISGSPLPTVTVKDAAERNVGNLIDVNVTGYDDETQVSPTLTYKLNTALLQRGQWYFLDFSCAWSGGGYTGNPIIRVKIKVE